MKILKVLNKNVLIRCEKLEADRKVGQIYLPLTVQEKGRYKIGTVVKLAGNCTTELSENDKVYYPWAVSPVIYTDDDNYQYVLVNEDNLIASITTDT